MSGGDWILAIRGRLFTRGTGRQRGQERFYLSRYGHAARFVNVFRQPVRPLAPFGSGGTPLHPEDERWQRATDAISRLVAASSVDFPRSQGLLRDAHDAKPVKVVAPAPADCT